MTVTATQGEKKHTTTTDENGRYAFPELADGVWKLEIEMLGFEKLTNEVGIAHNAPSPDWSLKMATMSAITAPKPAEGSASKPGATGDASLDVKRANDAVPAVPQPNSLASAKPLKKWLVSRQIPPFPQYHPFLNRTLLTLIPFRSLSLVVSMNGKC